MSTEAPAGFVQRLRLDALDWVVLAAAAVALGVLCAQLLAARDGAEE